MERKAQRYKYTNWTGYWNQHNKTQTHLRGREENLCQRKGRNERERERRSPKKFPSKSSRKNGELQGQLCHRRRRRSGRRPPRHHQILLLPILRRRESPRLSRPSRLRIQGISISLSLFISFLCFNYLKFWICDLIFLCLPRKLGERERTRGY